LLYGGTKLKKILIILVIIFIIITTGCSPQEYEVNIEISTEDTGEVVGEGTYEAGKEVEIAAVPKEEYEFIKWEVDVEAISEEQVVIITVDESKEIKANFKK